MSKKKVRDEDFEWAIKSPEPDSEIDDSSRAPSSAEAWARFLYPALIKEAFVNDGWTAVKVLKK